MAAGVKAFAPASIANIGCGYDILGLALDEPGDEVVASFCSGKGLKIKEITGDGGRLPYATEVNTASVAAISLLKKLEMADRGIALSIHKKMPFSSGLGSSAASAVAGAMAVNALLKNPFSKEELLSFAVEGEMAADGAYHADNVAPSLLGGIILVRHNPTLDTYRVPVPPGLYFAVVHPAIEIKTIEARSIIQPEISLNQHIEQSANLATLILGLLRSDHSAIRKSLKDVIIEPQRAGLIPHFYEVQEVALQGGALGCSISGAGPSVFAMFTDSLTASETGKEMARVFENYSIEATLYCSGVNLEGAKIC